MFLISKRHQTLLTEGLYQLYIHMVETILVESKNQLKEGSIIYFKLKNGLFHVIQSPFVVVAPNYPQQSQTYDNQSFFQLFPTQLPSTHGKDLSFFEGKPTIKVDVKSLWYNQRFKMVLELQHPNPLDTSFDILCLLCLLVVQFPVIFKSRTH